MLYKGGVFKQSASCDCAGFGYDPPVSNSGNLVGYSLNSQTEGCIGYWILQNNRGTDWGENGYAKLCIPPEYDKVIPGTCNSQYMIDIPDLNLIPFT